MKAESKAPVFNYISRCCHTRAEKEPCSRTPDEKKSGEWAEHSLGTWHCPQCGCPCKVDRIKPEKK